MHTYKNNTQQMESLNVSILDSLPLISLIMPYYDYAYDSVRVIRGLHSHSRQLWIENKSIIAGMLQKQTITVHNSKMNEKTIQEFLRGDKFMFFKFIFIMASQVEKAELVCSMLEQMNTLEIDSIKVFGRKKEIIDTLANWSYFSSKQDFFKCLKFSLHDSQRKKEEIYEYASRAEVGEFDMTKFCKHADCLRVMRLNEDLNIDWTARKIVISWRLLNKIQDHILGTQKFYDSIEAASLITINKDEVLSI